MNFSTAICETAVLELTLKLYYKVGASHKKHEPHIVKKTFVDIEATKTQPMISSLKHFNKHSIVYLIASLLWIGSYAHAQTQVLKLTEFSMSIFGTTNIHDFESKVTELDAQLVIKDRKEIQSMSVEIVVESIKSGNKIMDSKTYQAFGADKQPTITFKLKNSKIETINNSQIVTANGILSMAGKSQTIQLKTSAQTTTPGAYMCEGELQLNMTDFGMKPPTAFVGLMKVGEEVTVKYEIEFRE